MIDVQDRTLQQGEFALQDAAAYSGGHLRRVNGGIWQR